MVDPKHKFKQHVFSKIRNTIHLILCHMLSLNLCNYEWLLCLSLYQQRAVRRTAHISTLQKKALLPTMMDSSRFANIPTESEQQRERVKKHILNKTKTYQKPNYISNVYGLRNA